MERNMGAADRAIRLVIGLALIVAALFTGLLGDAMWLKVLAVVIGVVFLATSGTAFCPLYRPFGIKTCRS